MADYNGIKEQAAQIATAGNAELTPTQRQQLDGVVKWAGGGTLVPLERGPMEGYPHIILHRFGLNGLRARVETYTDPTGGMNGTPLTGTSIILDRDDGGTEKHTSYRDAGRPDHHVTEHRRNFEDPRMPGEITQQSSARIENGTAKPIPGALAHEYERPSEKEINFHHTTRLADSVPAPTKPAVGMPGLSQ